MKAMHISCVVCAKAKCKCVRLPGLDGCDRCTRLGRDCHSREPVRKKRNSKKRVTSTQLGHLEQKLDNLTQALTTRQQQEEDSAVAELAQITPTATPVATPPIEEQRITRTAHEKYGRPAIYLGPKYNSLQYAETVSSASKSQVENQTLLDRYATLMAPYMPFVLIPTPLTAVSLKHSPFVLRAILAVAHFHDSSVQQSLINDLISNITSSIFSIAGKSLDILQSLLILCAWYNPHLFTSASHSSLLHLCMALTTDLALDCDPTTCELAHMAAALQSHGIPQPARAVSDEERRAALGTFWVASTSFTSFRKSDVPAWTPWLSNCLDVLQAKGETVLTRLVSYQRITHEAMRSSTPETRSLLQTQFSSMPPPTQLSQNPTVLSFLSLHHSTAQIALSEPSFLTLPPDLTGIWFCIDAVHSFLDKYTAIPATSYLSIPFTAFAQFAYVFVVMVRATSVHIDGFDGTLMRECIDFEAVMAEASQKYEEVERLCVDGERVRNTGFESWARKTRWAAVYYGMKAREGEEQGGRSESGGAGVDAFESTLIDGDILGEGVWDTGVEDGVVDPDLFP